MSDNDTLQKFLFEHTPIRGELVHLDATWKAIQEKHDYPPLVRNMLGEMMAAAVLLAATLKLNGRLIIQLQGNGPITLMIVECSNAQELRGLAHWKSLPADGSLKDLAGNGKLTITLEPKDDHERYQSIVELKGETLAEALVNYLQQSEQLDTYLWLASNEQRASGLLLQKLPADAAGHFDENQDDDNWNRIVTLTSTVTTDELLGITELELLHRLYHEEVVRVYDPSPVCFRCTCSKERVASMLRNLGITQVKSIIASEGEVAVACEFCNQKYSFDSVDVEQLFSSHTPSSSSNTRH